MKINYEAVLDGLGCIPAIGTAVGMGEALYATIQLISQIGGLLQEQSLCIREVAGFDRLIEQKSQQNLNTLFDHIHACDEKWKRDDERWHQQQSLIEKQGNIDPKVKETGERAALFGKNPIQSHSERFPLQPPPSDLNPLDENIEKKDQDFLREARQKKLNQAKLISKKIHSLGLRILRGLFRATWIGGIAIALYHWVRVSEPKKSQS